MSPAIRSLVIPVSDLAAAKAVYTALLGNPHTDQPYYVDCAERRRLRGGAEPGRRWGWWAGGLRRRRRPRCGARDPARGRRHGAPTPPARWHRGLACACWSTATATRSACAAGSRRCDRVTAAPIPSAMSGTTPVCSLSR